MHITNMILSLSQTPSVVRRVVEGLSESDMLADHQPDDWGIGPVLVHMRDVERTYIGRITRMIDEDNPYLLDFDEKADMRATTVRPGDVAAALDEFGDLRRQTVALIESIDEDRPGVHSRVGPVSVYYSGRHLVSHDLQHIGQIVLHNRWRRCP